MPDSLDELQNMLKSRSLKIATAESCTGGMLAGTLTARPGSSETFDRGFVTYSNDSKLEVLKVPEAVLRENGAVSAETAKAMARGALKFSQADIAISTTGIAGPDGGTKEKPVGLVYIGFGKRGEGMEAKELKLDGDRHDIRVKTVQEAIQQALELLSS